jgi:hypothetical protein
MSPPRYCEEAAIQVAFLARHSSVGCHAVEWHTQRRVSTAQPSFYFFLCVLPAAVAALLAPFGGWQDSLAVGRALLGVRLRRFPRVGQPWPSVSVFFFPGCAA